MRLCLVAAAALALLAGAAAAAEPDGLAALRARGYLKICADPANLPFSSDDPATPGFEVELARLVAGELGVAPRMQWRLTYVRPLHGLRDGACDLFMGLPTDERFRSGNPWIAVSQPYYVMRHALVARADGPVRGVADLAGLRVAIEGGSIGDLFLNARGLQRGIYRRAEEVFRAVVTGEAGAGLLWLPPAAWMARDAPGIRVIPLTAEKDLDFPVGAGVRRRERELAAGVDAAIGRLRASGRVDEVLGRYRAVPPAATRRGPAAALHAADARDPIDAGRILFKATCAHCHGADGGGAGAGGRVPPIKHYEGGREKFLRVVRDGRRGTPMGGFRGILTDDEMETIYRYLTSFSRS